MLPSPWYQTDDIQYYAPVRNSNCRARPRRRRHSKKRKRPEDEGSVNGRPDSVVSRMSTARSFRSDGAVREVIKIRRTLWSEFVAHRCRRPTRSVEHAGSENRCRSVWGGRPRERLAFKRHSAKRKCALDASGFEDFRFSQPPRATVPILDQRPIMSTFEVPPDIQHLAHDLLAWIGYGTVVGLLAKAIMPGAIPAAPSPRWRWASAAASSAAAR